MNKPQSPEQLLQDVSRFITDSRELLDRGALMELEGLNSEVARLCEAVLSLTDEQRAIYAKKLQDVMVDLTRLGDDMAKQRDALASEIHGMSAHRNASVAYSKADAADGFGKKKDS